MLGVHCACNSSSLYSVSLTRAVVLVAVPHFRTVSLAGFSAVHLGQKVSRSALDSSATVVGTVVPFCPRQPLAVHRTVLQEASLALCVRTSAVAAIVLRDWVGAGSCPCLSSVVTGSAALTELCPLCPATINCTAKIDRG